jgi:deoxyribonuclease V
LKTPFSQDTTREERREKVSHPWNVSPKEAIEIQKRIEPLLRFTRLRRRVRYVAGADVSASKYSDDVWAGVVVCSYPELATVEERWVSGKTTFPYIPGLLSFREIPVLLEALRSVRVQADVILCDGQGTAHPRRMGLASHLGVLLDKPTIGCAKSRLVGEFSSPANEKGQFSLLRHKGKVIGAAARTRAGVKPVFVSPGDQITLEQSLEIVFRCCLRYRIPEPIRKAHLLVTELRKNG